MTLFFADLDFDSKERYDLGKFLEFNIDNYDPLTSFFLDEFYSLPIVSQYVIQKHVYRPDNISYEIYGDTQYWWLIMYFNSVTSITELTTDRTLSLFSLQDLESLYFNLKSQEVLNNLI